MAHKPTLSDWDDEQASLGDTNDDGLSDNHDDSIQEDDRDV